jgi:hypothetical protein
VERLTGHAELQELLGAYALDAVEPAEATVIELHLATCPRCRDELAQHREVAALLGYAGGAAPSGVWDRIVARLEEPPPALALTRTGATTIPTDPEAAPAAGPDGQAWGRGLSADDTADGGTFDADADAIARRWRPPTQPTVPTRRPEPSPAGVVDIARAGRPGSRRSRKTVPMRFMVAIATAAALVVAALGFELGRLETHKSQQPNLAELAYQVADANPKARHVTLTSTNGAYTVRAVIIGDGTTYLGPGNLQVLPSDETYQMLGIVNGDKVSLGVIGDNATYAAFTTPPVAQALAMTVEARGGVVSTTKSPVVEAPLPS